MEFGRSLLELAIGPQGIHDNSTHWRLLIGKPDLKTEVVQTASGNWVYQVV
jgi:hypothetical protein